jgi:hypothetical protein
LKIRYEVKEVYAAEKPKMGSEQRQSRKKAEPNSGLKTFHGAPAAQKWQLRSKERQ